MVHPKDKPRCFALLDWLFRRKTQGDASAARSDPVSEFALGNALAAQGRFAEAAAHYRNALSLRPSFPEAACNLGNVLKDAGDPGEAIPFYELAIAERAEFPEAHFNLGAALRQLSRYTEAIACLEATVRLRPDWAEALYVLGCLQANEDRRTEALECLRRAIARLPEYPEARWAYAMAQLLAICGPDDEATRGRAAFAAELTKLAHWFETPSRHASGAASVGTMQPFRLAYHEENNRDLLEQYGKLCARLLDRPGTAKAERTAAQRSATRLQRVAIVSRYFTHHSVWHAVVKGWFQRLNPERFSLYAFCPDCDEDAETALVRARAAWLEVGTRDIPGWVEAIQSRRPDVVIYPEIGMDPMTLRLACLRLAPVQIAAWGHPETTGLPTIDYYLSAEDFEPEGAQAFYTERLVALPHLGCYVEPADVQARTPDLQSLGLEPDVPLLVCPGTPFKYAPEHDHVLPEIAARLERCQFVFFTFERRHLSERLRLRLEATFRRHGLDPERYLRFVPWLNPPQFFGLLERAQVYLDTIGFSGFNTALQAVQCGLPIVTREGRFMRGRFASGILRRLEMPELIAPDKPGYVALAVRLATDAAFRNDVRERFAARRDRLWRDQAPIRALEQLLFSVLGPHN